MKLSIMQPYFFPYLGYFSLIKHTDKFILLDTVQFIRHGWVERNRILKYPQDWLYIQVPLIKSSRDTLIQDKIINNKSNWQQKILSQLQPYKKKAPYYSQVVLLLEKVLLENDNDIVSLNKRSLQEVCNYLGIATPISVFSEMNLLIDKPNAPDEWALNICKAVSGVTEYWNPPGGKSLFDVKKYNNEGIACKFQSVNLNEYSQKRDVFESGLSIIDVMMFNSPEEINKMLDDYSLI